MPGKFYLTIHLGNESIQTPEDLDRVLLQVGIRLRTGQKSGGIRDQNNKLVGNFGITGGSGGGKKMPDQIQKLRDTMADKALREIPDCEGKTDK